MKRIMVTMSAAAVALSLVVMAGQPAAKPNPYGLSHPEALAAMKRYDQAEAKAQSDYAKALATAREQRLVTLKALQVRTGQAGNTVESARLGAAILALTAEPKPTTLPSVPDGPDPGPALKLTTALGGSRWERAGRGYLVDFHKDHAITTTQQTSGTWAAVSGETIRISLSPDYCGGVLLKVSEDGKRMVDDRGEIDLTFKRKLQAQDSWEFSRDQKRRFITPLPQLHRHLRRAWRR
jgi:hypothetical protein